MIKAFFCINFITVRRNDLNKMHGTIGIIARCMYFIDSPPMLKILIQLIGAQITNPKKANFVNMLRSFGIVSFYEMCFIIYEHHSLIFLPTNSSTNTISFSKSFFNVL
jgi:hypothetical protein